MNINTILLQPIDHPIDKMLASILQGRKIPQTDRLAVAVQIKSHTTIAEWVLHGIADDVNMDAKD